MHFVQHPEYLTGPEYLAGHICKAVSANQIFFNDNLLVLLTTCDIQCVNYSSLAPSQDYVPPLCALFISCPTSSPSLSFSFCRRQGQFRADLKVITPSDLSQVSLCSIRHLSPSHGLCHPHGLSVCLSVRWSVSLSLSFPRLLKATCQFSCLTFRFPIPLPLSPIPFNLNMTRVRSASRQVAAE